MAGYIFTGIETSPKEMAPFHIVLGMVGTSWGTRASRGPQFYVRFVC